MSDVFFAGKSSQVTKMLRFSRIAVLVLAVALSYLGHCEEPLPVSRAEAIQIATRLFRAKSGSEVTRFHALLATMKGGRIVPLEKLETNTVITGAKDGDKEQLAAWEAKLDGTRFWLVTIYGAGFGSTYVIDAITGEDVGRKD